MDTTKLTHEQLDSAYRDYFRITFWDRNDTLKHNYENNFENYFQGILTTNHLLRWPDNRMNFGDFTLEIHTNPDFYNKWVNKLTDVEITLFNISTEDLIKELKKRNEFPIIKPEHVLEGARGKHINK